MPNNGDLHNAKSIPRFFFGDKGSKTRLEVLFKVKIGYTSRNHVLEKGKKEGTKKKTIPNAFCFFF
jgi:hypothetical protein